ncbi:MAG: exodeoxyribonuclease V subunit gamma [Rhizobacter sp.]
MTSDVQPGLLVLHGNRSELLRDALFEWIQRQPLEPLEEEVFLVQSNGVAEWLKMALAERLGVCAATRVELPARFLWRTYAQALGRDAVPPVSPFDKTALTWRLMAQLPGLLGHEAFEPLAGFLRGDDIVRRLQLCQRLADLFDQYQVYRSDWLDAWEHGRDVLPRPGANPAPVPTDQRWQPALWRELIGGLAPAERAGIRPQLHRRFVEAMERGQPPASPLSRRVVLFGMSHLPMQTLQSLAALSLRAQVLMAVPNPCRYHWADILQGRDALRLPRHRQPLRQGRDLAVVPLEDMHLHAHPLLAAWGRQGGDFIRQLDAFDDVQAARAKVALPQVDLFDDGPGASLLAQVQAAIRDLVPLAERPRVEVPPADRSIVFHVAHSAQREVEVLHDQLLALLAAPPAAGHAPLKPRDIVVMVPEIERFAPSIRAVFGQYGRGDARHIPFDIADVSERGTNPLVMAIEWLMRLPQERCRLNDVRDLLDVPAIAGRFGIGEGDLPLLTAWMSGAGVRWGLHGAQRADLGLGACGEQNTWLFGLRRMLLGYASGLVSAGVPFEGIEPYPEVGGLEARLAGSLAALVDALATWWQAAVMPVTPGEWAERLRALLVALVKAEDERDRLVLGALDDALRRWLEACDTAGFDERLPLAAVREAWLSGLDEPGIGRRFLGGGVTFCTLMPMRSIPFEVVCLLGMNDGDYPRSTTRSDFDLMGLAGQSRPGDRSRRDDDRQLMLEAVLSARRVLYISWTGRNARDNSELPPSVLVSQLRDHLQAGWSGPVLADRTTEHPLQPFSRRYFEGGTLFTHAREWRAAHEGRDGGANAFVPVPLERSVPLSIDALLAFLRHPVREFFRRRLGVVFSDRDAVPEDEETFSLDGLEEYQLVRELITDPGEGDVQVLLARRAEALQRAGRLPIGALGERRQAALVQSVAPMLSRWREVLDAYGSPAAKLPIRHEADGIVLEDWLDGLRSDGGRTVWVALMPNRLLAGGRQPSPRADQLMLAWLRALVAGAAGVAVAGVMVGRDASLTVEPVATAEAAAQLDLLMAAWRAGMAEPLPVALKTALAHIADPTRASAAYEGSAHAAGEVADAALARTYPDFEHLVADGRFATLAESLYGPLVTWISTSVQVVPHGQIGGTDD